MNVKSVKKRNENKKHRKKTFPVDYNILLISYETQSYMYCEIKNYFKKHFPGTGAIAQK